MKNFQIPYMNRWTVYITCTVAYFLPPFIFRIVYQTMDVFHDLKNATVLTDSKYRFSCFIVKIFFYFTFSYPCGHDSKHSYLNMVDLSGGAPRGRKCIGICRSLRQSVNVSVINLYS